MNATLITTGRKSGEPRTVKLYVWPDGDERFVLVGSSAGQPEDPAWVLNLRAEPRCALRFSKTDERAGRVTEIPEGTERDRLWALVVEAFRYYGTYQRKTDRLIPLFVFTADTATD